MRSAITLLLLLLALVSTAADRRRLLLGRNAAAAGGGGGGAPDVESFNTTNSTGFSSSITNWVTTSGANRLIVVHIGIGDASLGVGPTSISIDGGANITNNVLWNTNDGNFVTIQAYYALAPSSGAHVIKYDAGGSFDQFVLATVCWTNAHQTLPFGSAATAKGNNASPTVAVSSAASVEKVVGQCSTDSQASLAVSGGTEIWKIANLDADTDHAAAKYTGATTVNASWTQTSGPWVAAGISIKAP